MISQFLWVKYALAGSFGSVACGPLDSDLLARGHPQFLMVRPLYLYATWQLTSLEKARACTNKMKVLGLKKKSLFFIGAQLINSMRLTVLVSGIQQIDSVIHMHVSTIFQTLFPIQVITEYWAEFPVLHPCWLSILNRVVCTCQSKSPNQSLLLTHAFRKP